MKNVEITVFNDKSWVRLTEFQRLEKEKCELLGIIQRKDEVIRKMRNCHNCKNASFSYGDNFCNLLMTSQCRNYDKWEIRG